MYVCVCIYICMCVCVYVCGSAAAQTEGSILMKFSTNDLTDICEVLFFWDSEISKSMTSWQPFCTFSPGNSDGRNFALIFFKIVDKVESCLLLLKFS